MKQNTETRFVLFQTDQWKMRCSRSLFGVFASYNAALHAAKINDLFSYDSEVDIVECETDKFEDL